MTARTDHDLLIRIDQRTKAIEEKQDLHIESCSQLYATKQELGQVQLRPLVWLASASLVGIAASFGDRIAGWFDGFKG